MVRFLALLRSLPTRTISLIRFYFLPLLPAPTRAIGSDRRDARCVAVLGLAWLRLVFRGDSATPSKLLDTRRRLHRRRRRRRDRSTAVSRPGLNSLAALRRRRRRLGPGEKNKVKGQRQKSENWRCCRLPLFLFRKRAVWEGQKRSTRHISRPAVTGRKQVMLWTAVLLLPASGPATAYTP